MDENKENPMYIEFINEMARAIEASNAEAQTMAYRESAKTFKLYYNAMVEEFGSGHMAEELTLIYARSLSRMAEQQAADERWKELDISVGMWSDDEEEDYDEEEGLE